MDIFHANLPVHLVSWDFKSEISLWDVESFSQRSFQSVLLLNRKATKKKKEKRKAQKKKKKNSNNKWRWIWFAHHWSSCC